MRRASGVHALSPRRQSSASVARELLVALRRVEDAPHDELRRDRAVPVVLLEAERDVEATRRAQPVELRALPEGDRAPGVAPVLAHAEAQVLPVADGRRRDGLGQPGRGASTSGLPRPNGARRSSSSRELERQVLRRDDSVHDDRPRRGRSVPR